MADREPIILEFDASRMWELAEDKKALSLCVEIPAMAGILEPVTVHIDFDYESVRMMIMRLRTLSMQMAR